MISKVKFNISPYHSIRSVTEMSESNDHDHDFVNAAYDDDQVKQYLDDSGEAQTIEPNNDPEKSTTSEKIQLAKQLTYFHALAYVIGNVIGSGIFATPTSALISVGSVGFMYIVWVVGGCFDLLFSFCFMELTSMLPISGGIFNFFLHAYGPLVGFFYAFVNCLITVPMNCSMTAIVFGEYLLEIINPGCALDQREDLVKLIGWCTLGKELSYIDSPLEHSIAFGIIGF